MHSDVDAQPQYPIGAVAQRTGLSTHVLRAWERRYGLVEPRRDDNGVRLYSNAEIVRLRLLRRVTEAGHPIGRVADLGTEQLVALVREEEQSARDLGRTPPPEAPDRFLAACLEGVEAMDGRRIHNVLTRAVLGLSLMDFVEDVVSPLMRRVGEMYVAGDLCSAHEHLCSVSIQRILHWILDTLPGTPGAPLLLSTTPPGQRHELGAMLASVVAADAGWRTVYFGADLPVEDIVRAAVTTGADAVALSATYDTLGEPLPDLMRRLRADLPGDVYLFLGGPAAVSHGDRLRELEITSLADLTALRIALQATGKVAGA